MSKENLMCKTCKELRELAKELSIPGRWDMTKGQLIEAILGAENAEYSKSKCVNKHEEDINMKSANDENKVDNCNDCVETEAKCENESVCADVIPDMSQKMSYIEGVEIGTIVAFRLSNGRVKSAKVVKKSTKMRKLKLETSYGAEYIISYDDIVWVRTGKRWPRGIYNLLKGIADNGGKEQASV